MVNISQSAVGSIWFYRFHRKFHVSKQKEYILVAIALTTGIPISNFFGKYWHDFIKTEVNGRYVIPKISYKNELHTLPWIVVDLIKRVNQSNNLPINEKILEDFDWDSFIYDKFLKKYFPENNLSDFDIDFLRYPQILFGRQILYRNGYTNGIGIFLKSMFGFKLNKELEKFLLVGNLSKCHLKLGSIDLYCPDELFVFKDKGFSTNRDYYNFLAFDEYLSKCIMKRKSNHIRSIYILISICLYNGLRPAFLKNLRWKDITEINEEDGTLKIYSEFKYRGIIISIPNKYRKDFNLLCPISRKNTTSFRFDTFIPHLKEGVEDFIVNNPKVFTSAKGGDLQLQSLKRDIQKTLKSLDFDYWDKVTTLSFQRMWGRRILEINGDHKLTIRELKKRINLKSKRELFIFLDVFKSKNETSTFKDKRRETYSDYINFSMEYYIKRIVK